MFYHRGRFAIFLFLLLMLVCVNGIPHTVGKLDLPKYAGLWYQVFYNQFVARSQQPNQMCVVEQYNNINQTSLLATQYSRQETPFGPEMKTKAKIIRPDEKIPGTFQFLLSGAPYPVPYLVIKLGPINKHTGLYEYSVVTDSNGVSLYVFARDIKAFRRDFEEEVLHFCHENGFSSYYNQPIVSPQPDACKYYGGDMKDKDDDELHDNFPTVIQM